MMKKWPLKFIGLLFIPLLNGCPTDVNAPAKESIDPNATVIGLIQTLASGGEQDKERAARMAITEINAAGGVNGRQLALHVTFDSNSNTNAGLAAAAELTAGRAVAIVGANASRVTLPVAQQITIPADIALVSPGSTATQISTLADNDTVYRIPPSDALQGSLLADLVWGEGFTSVAIFTANEPYGLGLADSFSTQYVALGGTVQAQAIAPDNKTDGFDSEINTLYASGAPDAIMLFSFSEPTSNFLRELLSSKGSLPMLYGVDANIIQDTLNNSPSQIVGMRGTKPSAPLNRPEHLAFTNAFFARTGITPTPNIGNTYDAIYLIALALAQAGTTSRNAVIANLRDVSGPDNASPVTIGPGQFAAALEAIGMGADIDYQGVTSDIDFDAQGDPSNAFYRYIEVQNVNGTLQLVTLNTVSYP